MDAKKCDRCGRYYSEYGKYKAGDREFEVKKSSMIRTGTKILTGKFLCEKHFDLCPICMDELDKFLNDPNAFQCLGNCNECENYDDCEALEQAKEIEEYEGKVFKELYEEKPMRKFKATTPDGKTVFGNLIRWELLSCWMVHENGETLINPDTIEKLSDGE